MNLTTLEPVITAAYPPSEAEDGKFVPIDLNTLTALGYPASGFGKFAILVYNIGSPAAPATSSIPITPSTIVLYSGTYNNTANVVTPATPLKSIEVYNNDEDIQAYFLLSSTSFVNLTSLGLPIPAKSYYTIAHNITTFTVGASAGSVDLRIVGRY